MSSIDISRKNVLCSMDFKEYKLAAHEIKELIPFKGFCIATDKITVDGLPVGFMYREEPDEDDEADSGWRIFSGTEDQEYVDDPENSGIYELNTIANYDPAIINYLDKPIGTELERVEGKDEFRELK